MTTGTIEKQYDEMSRYEVETMTDIVPPEGVAWALVKGGALHIRDVANGEEPYHYSSGNFGPGYVLVKGAVGNQKLFKFMVRRSRRRGALVVREPRQWNVRDEEAGHSALAAALYRGIGLQPDEVAERFLVMRAKSAAMTPSETPAGWLRTAVTLATTVDESNLRTSAWQASG